MARTRILIVHPDPQFLAALGSMLRSPEFEVIEAASDRAAVRMMEVAPSLVIHAVDPDDPDALELLAYARRKHPGTPVILLFAAVFPERCNQAIDMGASAVLGRPLRADVLRAAAAQALGADDFEALKEALGGREREIIAQALEAAGGDRQEAARSLGIGRTTLYKKMKKHGLLEEGSPSRWTGAASPE